MKITLILVATRQIAQTMDISAPKKGRVQRVLSCLMVRSAFYVNYNSQSLLTNNDLNVTEKQTGSAE